MSIAGVENSFIVKKAKNFSLDERTETGYRWSQKHQERSPIFLKSGIKVKLVDLITHNCEVIKTHIEYKNSEKFVHKNLGTYQPLTFKKLIS